jgi:hypothetical protein
MADRDKFEPNGDERGLWPPSAAVEPKARAKVPGDLPDIESPSISPAVSEAVAVEEEAIEPKPEPEIEAAKYSSLRALVPVTRSTFDDVPPFEPIEIEEPRRRIALKPRHWRTLRLAAAVAIGAGFGAIAGTYFTGGFAEPTKVADVAAQDENKAVQQSLVKMATELTTLKANLEASAKRAEGRTASLEQAISDKINERINERLHREAAAETTGSIPAAQSAAVTYADVPTPRPAPRLAMAQSQTLRSAIVRDWSVRGAFNGYVYVQGRYGDVYQVVPGAPLPGLGPVESIKRTDGRWVVTTPKGIIVSMRDRHHFE